VLSLAVRDDGKGFEIAELDESDGLGIAGMRERATLAGGSLDVISEPGTGTQVIFKVPFKVHD